MVNPSVCPQDTDLPFSGIDVELADVVRRFAPEYISQYGPMMMPSQKRALSDIAACCTKELGGCLHRCDDCQETFWTFHCCRNRSCPKCHATQTREWLEKREAELLPCGYFHAVATVPSQLHGAFHRDQKFMYGSLMRVSAESVMELCAVKRHLGALPGILSLLHTWNAQLAFHPHVHMLITAGGVTSDGESWVPARGNFLVPVRALSARIAAKFRKALQKDRPELFATIPADVWKREWVSFCKHYGHGNDAVLNYLSRYVFRVAITNARIVDMDDTHVTYRWKDRHADVWRTTRVTGVEFLRRYLQHVLPRGFHKVRYCGLWHHSKRQLSTQAWLLLMLDKPAGAMPPLKIADLLERSASSGEADDPQFPGDEYEKAPRCPHCGSPRTRLVAQYPRLGVP